MEAWKAGHLLDEVYLYQRPLRPEQWDDGDKARVVPNEIAFVEAAAFLISVPHVYDLAHKVIGDGLLLFPSSLPLMYMKAIICQLIWAQVGPLRMKRLDVLEEGMDWLRKARRVDGEMRQGFSDSIFQCAFRLLPQDPLTMLAHTIAIQSVYSFFPQEVPGALPVGGVDGSGKKSGGSKALAGSSSIVSHVASGISIDSMSQVSTSSSLLLLTRRKPYQQMQFMAHRR